MTFAGVSTASVVVVAIAVITTAGLGAWLTKLGPWYWHLRKPKWQPPDFLFGPVWTLVFAMIGTSAVLSWNSSRASQGDRIAIVSAYAINLALNAWWSALFFAKRRPDLALTEVVCLWLSIVAVILVVRPVSAAAAWLLTPYLAWVSFAAVLNQRIVALNGPFTDY